MDAAFTTVIARKHYGNEIDDSEPGQRRSRAIKRLLNQLNSDYRKTQTHSIAWVKSLLRLRYLIMLTFRLPEVKWKEEYPQLEVWHAGVTARASFKQTAFA